MTGTEVAVVIGACLFFFALGWFYGWSTRGRVDLIKAVTERIREAGQAGYGQSREDAE